MYTRLKEFRSIIKRYNYTCNVKNLRVHLFYDGNKIGEISSFSLSTKNENWLIYLTESVKLNSVLTRSEKFKDMFFILEGEIRKRKIEKIIG